MVALDYDNKTRKIVRQTARREKDYVLDGVAEAEILEEEDKRYYNSGVYCSRTLSTCTTMAPPYSVYDNDVAWLATIGGGP